MGKILITGGAGFVGRNLIRHIRSFFEDAHITVIDDLSEDAQTFFDQGLVNQVDRLYAGFDVTDPRFSEWARSWHFDLCIHCAAVVRGKLNQVQSPLSVAKNLAIDAAVISAVNNGLAKELIYFSSCAAYGAAFQSAPKATPNFESQLIVGSQYQPLYPPEGMYGWCKVMGEVLCSQLSNTKVTVLRPFGGYGTDQKDTYPFPAIVKRVQRGDDPVVIWGSGKQVRDWIHVKDICRLAFEAHSKNAGVVNLGTGVETSFTELAIQVMTKAERSEYVLRNSPDKPEGVAYRVADTVKMNRFRMFAHIRLEQGIEMALAGEL